MTVPIGAQHATLAAQLRTLGHLDVAEAQLAPLAIDGRRPVLALSPDSPDAVAAAVGIAAEHGGAVAPHGSGTKTLAWATRRNATTWRYVSIPWIGYSNTNRPT